MNARFWRPAFATAALVCGAVACDHTEPADLVLVNARVYTMAWDDPSPLGAPALNAPRDARGWHPQADALAIRGGRIVAIGDRASLEKFRGPNTDERDLRGATVLPGLIDSHVHLAELGASLERVDLVGVKTEAEAVARIVERAKHTPKDDWIVGWGWDEGAWANHYPTSKLLSEKVPDHPVVLRGLHSFAVWGNQLALDKAGITTSSSAPEGGEIRKDAAGKPTGILTNNATRLLTDAVPKPTPDQLADQIEHALETLANAGYVAVHEAGADTAEMHALEQLDAAGRLPLRVYAMLAGRDRALVDAWRARGPVTVPRAQLTVRAVKAFYDGAMGSRGAYFIDDYSDDKGHRGRGGADYGFDAERMAAMMRAGFQLVVHAIGDRANRETLDLIERVERASPDTKATRPRIEHAQVLAALDIGRFATLDVIASMQPSHAVEDMGWAEKRIGPDRVNRAYAWREIRKVGGRLALNSDLPGTDYNFFYGVHSAVTRQDRNGLPEGGWHPSERLTIDEAIRGWTTWAAYAGFEEGTAGILATGRRADLTVVDIDPFVTAETQPGDLLSGKVVLTIGAGRILFDRVPPGR